MIALPCLGGCATSPLVSAAERGDYATLRQKLDTDKRKLDGGTARSIARAVVKHEVSSAKPEDVGQRVDELRLCLDRVDDVLIERAKTHDDGGARAAFLLVDGKLVSMGKWRGEASSDDAAWRAVGARTLVGGDHGQRRRELFLDMDVRVRQSALYASLDAVDAADETALLETVRLDPDGAARGIAARAAGALGGAHVVLNLRDRWATADDPLRTSIVTAWGTKASLDTGGLEQLVWAAEVERGTAAITAGNQLLRAGGPQAASGRAAMVRAIEDGPAVARVVAINLASPDDADVLAAIKKASEAQDGKVKVAALSKLTLDKASRDAALTELGTIAAGSSPERNAARTALASAGDRRVVALLAEDTSAPEPGVRAWAAAQLASMKEFPDAARVMADEDVSARTRAACAILAMRK